MKQSSHHPTTRIGDVAREAVELFRMDAARWVDPEFSADPTAITPMVAVRLLVSHVPLRAMAWFRLGSAAKTIGVRGFPGWTQRRLLRLYGLELSVGAPIGGGLYIAHPSGCVLAVESMGENVTVVAQVVFGAKGSRHWPTVGDRAYLGAGAKVIGGISIGHDAVVGANAVVLSDVPPETAVVGVPARPVA